MIWTPSGPRQKPDNEVEEHKLGHARSRCLSRSRYLLVLHLDSFLPSELTLKYQ